MGSSQDTLGTLKTIQPYLGVATGLMSGVGALVGLTLLASTASAA
ncbi:hypothetical protein GCM10023094_01530 [Rhodococcus olei]|uniref:Uncharacterized protein n=1 Tax=Rhodococcus olei TaxID=2161675 RepID=A0ABP8NT03_9NOCA